MSRRVNGEPEGSPVPKEDEEEEDEDMPEAGPSTNPNSVKKPDEPTAESPTIEEGEANGEAVEEKEEGSDIPPPAPPRILVTTSPSPCKETYQFCEDLRGIFPGGQFFKRPKGRGFELGRVARWAGKRGYGAVIVVNEDHKMPSKSRGSERI